MVQELVRPSRHPQCGEHLCCIYESSKEKMSLVVPFLAIGLELNEKCVYISDQNSLDEARSAIHRVGLDAARFEATGQLVLKVEAEVCPLAELYVRDNGAKGVKTLAREIMRSGHRGYRSIIDVTNFIHIIDSNALIYREVKLNRQLSNMPATMLLLYQRSAIPDYVVSDIFRIHPRIIDGTQVYENPHFIPPDELL